ncbi:MAG: hypothetical protein A4E73_03840 [Syntrophaceae bacterium PtaU1.Bin231]|nr:MAG: hypothetical protein A4E73_03840 [Syntrophaceae bacterium PtaU1.Bin231]
MKTRLWLLAIMMFLFYLPAVHAQEEGKLRAMQQRAAHITKLKNDYVARVLNSYKIPNERNADGVVIRISMNGQWVDVKAIDIVPVLKESADKKQYVAGHELYFYTQNEILDLLSDLIIR